MRSEIEGLTLPNDQGQALPANDANREAELTAPSAVACTHLLEPFLSLSLLPHPQHGECNWEIQHNTQEKDDD